MGGKVSTIEELFFNYSIDIFRNFWMKYFSCMKRQYYPFIIFQIDSVAAFSADVFKSWL